MRTFNPKTSYHGSRSPNGSSPRQATEEPVADFSALDDFMVYSDDDGTAMKLPKKLFALVNCQDGDGSCKERIQSLRQKLTAAVAPSDFTGMLDLVRQLQ